MATLLRKRCWKLHDSLWNRVRRVSVLRNLFVSRAGQRRCLKAGAGFAYGLLLGLGLYSLVLVDLDFSPDICYFTGFVITLMLAIGNAVSTQVRCICALAVPGACERGGRAAVRALALSLVLGGPVANLGANARDAVRVFGCAASLSFNLTRARFDLMLRPIADGLLRIKGDASEAKQALRGVRDVMVPVAEEMEGEEEMRRVQEENDYMDELQGDSKRSAEAARSYAARPGDGQGARLEKKYAKKLHLRCEAMMSKSGERCRKAFSDAYNRCYHKVTFLAAWLLCWPMKLNFVCNVVEALGGAGACEASKHLDAGVGDGYLSLKGARKQLAAGLQDAQVQFQAGRLPPALDVRGARDAAQALKEGFERKKKAADRVATLLRRLLAFAFVRLLLDAQEYHDKFVSDVQWDNAYVTRYFRRVDARRRRRGRLTLLPLRKAERKEMVDPWSLCPQPKERADLWPQLVRLLLEMLTPAAFVLMDILLFEALDLVRRHAHIEYTQTGKHELSLRVLGSGFLARLVRSVLRRFNFRHRVRSVRSNAACLPRPRRPSGRAARSIVCAYAALLALVAARPVLLRLRRAVCAYFYPKREKQRVLFLYNESLKRRVGTARHLLGVVRRRARENRLEVQASFLAALRVRCPGWCSWLRIFPAARQKCLICSEVEPFSRTRRRKLFIDCPNPDCHAVYCKVCWHEAGEICYACSFIDESSSDQDTGLGDGSQSSD